MSVRFLVIIAAVVALSLFVSLRQKQNSASNTQIMIDDPTKLNKKTKNNSISPRTPLSRLYGKAKVAALLERGGSHFKAEDFQPMPPLPSGSKFISFISLLNGNGSIIYDQTEKDLQARVKGNSCTLKRNESLGFLAVVDEDILVSMKNGCRATNGMVYFEAYISRKDLNL